MARQGAGHAVYRRIVASRFRSQLAYPTSFALDLVAQFAAQGVELLVIVVVFTQTTELGGFTRTEAVVMYGIAATAFGIAALVVSQVEELPLYIRTGEFDVILLRPLSTLGQVLAADVSLKRVGRVVAGLLVYVVALVGADLVWTPLRAVVAVGAPVFGAVIIGAVYVAANSVSFWLVDGREFASSVTYGSSYSTSFPITVYGPWLRRALSYAIPAAFVAYFPALALLGRPDPLGLPAFLQWSSPLVAAVAVGVAALVWRTGIRRYQGTGS